MDSKLNKLREDAENILKNNLNYQTDVPLNEFNKIIHDLKVYQIELELQNEELRNTQKLLEDSRNNYAQLYNEAPAGYVTLNESAMILQANQTFARMVNRNSSAINNLSFTEFIDDDDIHVFISRFNAFFKKPEGKSMELKILKQNGKAFNARITANIINNESDKVKLLLIITDITEQKNAKDLIIETQHNYENFFNTIDDFLFVLDEEGNILYSNSTAQSRLEYSENELIEKHVLNLHPEERRAEASKIVQEMLSGYNTFCPIPLITKSGKLIPVETKINKGFWNGKAVLFGVSKDITQLKLSEEKFSKVFYLNPSACGLSDLTNHQYIEVNDAFYNLLGFNKNEVIGKTGYELGILEYSAAEKILETADSNGKIENQPLNLKAKNGDIKSVLISAENIYIQDKRYRFTVLNDITELRKIESELKKQNKELLSLNAKKDKFFSIIAHDLRSPFNSFLGLTQIMANEINTLTMPELQRIAVNMEKSANNLYNLLENLLQWSQIHQGLTIFNPTEIQLITLINTCVENMHDVAINKNIEIIVDINEEINFNVIGDENMLKTVIRNLISNAIKFTNTNGAIRIKAEKDINQTIITVTDNGIGMTKENIVKLFKLEESYSSNGTENEKGTGLGLLLCKEFIEKHRGKIWVESEKGNGSTFYFSLPSIN